MKNILLCCSAGMSTSMLVLKMNQAAEEVGIKAKIWAVGMEEVEKNLEEADVVLLGPQIRYKLNSVKSICEPKNIPAEVINTVDYGSMNGKKVLKHAITLIG